MADAPLKPLSAPRRFQVLLLIESSREYGRGCLHGIASYMRLHGTFHCLHLERASEGSLAQWLKKWKPDGVIARIESREVARTLAKLNVPVVDLTGTIDLPKVPRIWTDSDHVAQLAAEHFLDRGFTRFAYCGYPGVQFSDMRCDAFVRYLGGKGFTVDQFREPSDVPAEQYTQREIEGVIGEAALGDWLAGLPRPVAVMTCNDVRGQQLLSVAAERGIRVPEHVAVVGCDDDDVVCDFAVPSLSSVEPDTRTIGFQAATLLERMMRGEPGPVATIGVKPLGVVTRLSSDMLAVDDPIVAQAIGLIREHAFAGINVEQLLDHLPVSRATLERRFTKYFSRSPKEEIMRVRMTRSQQLLRETDYSLATIAEMSGFKTAAHLSVVVKSRIGISPGEYRTRHRTGEAKRSTLANAKIE